MWRRILIRLGRGNSMVEIRLSGLFVILGVALVFAALAWVNVKAHRDLQRSQRRLWQLLKNNR